MKYINVFADEAAYNASAGSLEKPQLSYITDGGKIFSLSAGGGGSDVEFVDLGLSVKWANMNVDATGGNNVEDWYGNYYAWGEIADKRQDTSGYSGDNYAHATYTWVTDPDEPESGWWECQTISKYNTSTAYGEVDGKTTLDTTDDAAAQNNQYRMPTQEECQALIDGTDNEWVENYNGITGLNGYKFTNKTDSDKFIFIPAAGIQYGSERYYAGEYGLVWSASLFSDNPYGAFNLLFDSNGVSVGSDDRYDGLPVRGVQNSPAN